MTLSEASLETRQPAGRRVAVGVFIGATGLLLGLMVWMRVWLSGVETFDRQGQFTTPARPPTPPVYDPGPGFAKGSEHVFALKEPEGPSKGWLARELVRQGVMIAAQDALGLELLDSSLGDVIPQRIPGQSFPVSLVSVLIVPTTGLSGRIEDPWCRFQVELSRPTITGPTFTWSSPETKIGLDPTAAVEVVEGYSRSDFVQFLEQAGFERATAVDDEPLPSIPEDHFDVPTQFSRIRSLHARIRANPTSAELLGDLVRAYANLGSLTDFYWSATSKVFKARALLYSQRLVATFGRSPYSLAHQAYARALTGFHQAALDEIEAARTAEGIAAPDWLDLIEAYCAYRPNSVEGMQSRYEELALYLRLRMYDVRNDQVRTLEAARRFLARSPACSRAVELFAEARSVSAKKELVEAEYRRLWPQVYQRLVAIPDFPTGAQKLADVASLQSENRATGQSSRQQLIDDLQKAATPPGIPSWKILAWLLTEESFVQAWRTVDAEANWLRVSPDESLLDLSPLIAGHPMAKALQWFGSSEWPMNLDFKSVDVTAMPLLEQIKRKAGAVPLWSQTLGLMSRADPIYEDYGPKCPDHYARTGVLKQASPHWPLSITDDILGYPPIEQSQRDHWEQTYADAPAVLNALAEKYDQLGRPKDAIRCWKKSLAISPAGAAFLSLANVYRAEGDFENRQQTLEEAVHRECYGAEIDQLHLELADGYMRHGTWDKAEPHAVAAVKVGTRQGLQMAARCTEGQQKWDEAEQFIRLISKQFPERRADWHFWCVRTGRGDGAGAKELATAYWANLGGRKSEQLWSLGLGQILDGDLATARLTLHDLFLQHEDTAAGTLAAVAADLQGQPLVRDGLFNKISFHWSPPEGHPVDRGQRHRDPFPELTNLMRRVLRDGDWAANEFELLVVDAEKSDIPLLYCLSGIFLAYRGQQELANNYLRYAVSSPQSHSPACILAVHALRTQNINVESLQLEEVPDSMVVQVSLFKRVTGALQRDHLDRAESLVNELLARQPDFLPALLLRGKIGEARGNYGAAIATYEEMLKVDPNYSMALYRLAWLLAACPEDKFRNGKQAMVVARRLTGLRTFDTYAAVSTLAAATAECGDVNGAEKIELRATGLPGNKRSKTRPYEDYVSGRPCRRLPPWKQFPGPDDLDFDNGF